MRGPRLHARKTEKSPSGKFVNHGALCGAWVPEWQTVPKPFEVNCARCQKMQKARGAA